MRKNSISALLVKSVFTLAVFFSTGAQANLIQNGGFEEIGGSTAIGGYGSANTWQIYSSIPDWSATRNMEIWANNFIVSAYEGSNLLELNGHPGTAGGAFSIYQSFNTVAGQQYELSFAARKRQNSTEQFSVSVGDLDNAINSHVVGSWTEFSYIFEAANKLSTLQFTSLDPFGDTTGNLLDDISVSPVPVPAAVWLFGTALLGLVGFSRRKKVA